jgi:hypothetical protein
MFNTDGRQVWRVSGLQVKICRYMYLTRLSLWAWFHLAYSVVFNDTIYGEVAPFAVLCH